MSDELDLLDRYMESAPEPGPSALETARRRLEMEIGAVQETDRPSTGPERALSRSRRRTILRPLVAAATVAAAVLLVLTGILGPPSGHPAPSTGTGPTGTGPTGRPVVVPRSWTLAGYISRPGWQIDVGGRSLSTSQQFTTGFTCPTVTTCYSTGTNTPSTHQSSEGAITVTHDGGGTWRQSLSPSNGTYFFGITCPTPDTCMVPAEIPNTDSPPTLYTTTDGGRRWTWRAMPGAGAAFVLLSCPTSSDCVALEMDLGRTGPARNLGVSYVTSDGGGHWRTSELPHGFIPSGQSALQCFAGGTCIAAGTETTGRPLDQPAAMIYSTDDGATWTAGSLPRVTAIASMMSCVDAQHCLSLEQKDLPSGEQTASGVLVTDDGGRTWSAFGAHDLDPVNDRRTAINFASISCSTPADCSATGIHYESLCQGSCPYSASQGVIMGTADGGRRWTSEALPTPPSADLQYSSVYPMTCVTETDCLAVATLAVTGAAAQRGVSTSVQQDVVLSNTGGPVRTRSSTRG